jgi:kynurenine formamidase
MPKLALALLIVAALSSGATDHKVTKADIAEWMTKYSNWGRWGQGDQLGALNLITPAKRRQAVALVKDGYSISMAHNVLTEKANDNENPFIHTMVPAGGGFHMDNYNVSFHGMGQTHLDAFCHASFEGKMYGGVPVDSITAEGCPKDSVLPIKNGIMTRGVIIDIARLKGLDYLEPGTPIYPEDLAAWEKKTGVKVSPGDAVFVRSGRWAMRAARGPTKTFAGLHASCIPWLHDHGVAVLGGDADPEVIPSQVEGIPAPIHLLALVGMGIPLFDECDLEDVAKEAAKLKRWVFLFTAAPLAVPGGTGSPINPTATF